MQQPTLRYQYLLPIFQRCFLKNSKRLKVKGVTVVRVEPAVTAVEKAQAENTMVTETTARMAAREPPGGRGFKVQLRDNPQRSTYSPTK